MSSTATVKAARAQQIDRVANDLLSHTALLTRLLTREVGGPLSRTEVTTLRSLTDGPRRITELAELVGLAQPTTTLLVKRLEEQGFVRRERQGDDHRVVLVTITAAGTTAFEDACSRARSAMRGYLADMPEDQLQALVDATGALEHLIALILGDGRREGTGP